MKQFALGLILASTAAMGHSAKDYEGITIVFPAGQESFTESVFNSLDLPIEAGGSGSSEGASGTYDLKRIVYVENAERIHQYSITSYAFAWSGSPISAYGLRFGVGGGRGTYSTYSQKSRVDSDNNILHQTRTMQIDIAKVYGTSVAQTINDVIRQSGRDGRFQDTSVNHDGTEMVYIDLDCGSAAHCTIKGVEECSSSYCAYPTEYDR
jgi:hypothetical protein